MTAIMQRETSALQLAAQANQLFDFGNMLIKSGMLPNSVRTPEAAMAIIVKGMELGLPPMAALAGITVIQGKPTVSPQLMLSLINRSGQLENLDVETGVQGATVTMKRRGRSPFTARFGPAEAKAMQLDGKDNYKKQAPVMYQWRAVAGCARVVFPDVIDGLYTPEEMGADVQVDEDGAMTVSVQQEAKPSRTADVTREVAQAAGAPLQTPGPTDAERLDGAVRSIAARLDECRKIGRLTEAQAFLADLDYKTNLDAAAQAFRGLKQFTVPAPAPEAQSNAAAQPLDIDEPVEATVVLNAEGLKALQTAYGNKLGLKTPEQRHDFATWMLTLTEQLASTKDLTEEQAAFLTSTINGWNDEEIADTLAKFQMWQEARLPF